MAKYFQRTCQLGLLAKDLMSLRHLPHRPASRDARLKAVSERLGLLHGLPQKIGQLLAFSDLPERSASFSSLAEGEATLTPEEAFSAMEAQLGRRLSECFSWVSPHGISASIGQVHKARTHGGQDVAIKIQYPGISKQVAWDLRALGWLSAPVGDLRRGFDLEAYRQEIGAMLSAELDYRREAEAAARFEALARCIDRVRIPQILPEFSGEQILTSTWIDGTSVHSTQEWPLEDRSLLANDLARFFLHSLFEWGSLHADPHPGNYRFIPRSKQEEPILGVIDFGCVKPVSSALSTNLADLILRSMEGSLTADQVLIHFVGMGFDEARLGAMKTRLLDVANVLGLPFASHAPLSVGEWALGERLAEALGEDRPHFRTSGPPELIYVLRTLQGVLRHLDSLQAPVDWRRHFQRLVLEKHSLPKATAKPPCFSPGSPMKSESLHIQVTEAERTKVALTFSAEATDHLAQLIPLEYRERLSRHDINLAEISARARSSGYAPGALFTLDEGSKTVRVWLA